ALAEISLGDVEEADVVQAAGEVGLNRWKVLVFLSQFERFAEERFRLGDAPPNQKYLTNLVEQRSAHHWLVLEEVWIRESPGPALDDVHGGRDAAGLLASGACAQEEWIGFIEESAEEGRHLPRRGGFLLRFLLGCKSVAAQFFGLELGGLGVQP